MIDKIKSTLPSVNSEHEIMPTAIDIMDLPLGLHPGFIEFFNNAKNCDDYEERQSIAKDFFNDFLTSAELTQKTKYIKDVGNYEDSIKQLPIYSTIPVVKKHKDLVASRIDQDILLNNKSSQFDVFFKNTLERLYETLKDHHLLKQPANQDLQPSIINEYESATALVKGKESKDIQYGGVKVSITELALIINYIGRAADITDTNWREKSDEYGLAPSRAIYNHVRKWDKPEKRQLLNVKSTPATIVNQIHRLNKIRQLIPNTFAINIRFDNDMNVLTRNNI